MNQNRSYRIHQASDFVSEKEKFFDRSRAISQSITENRAGFASAPFEVFAEPDLLRTGRDEPVQQRPSTRTLRIIFTVQVGTPQ